MAMSAPKQVAAIWAVLLALAAVVDVAMGNHRPDEVSYRAGYAAVSNPVQARTLMAVPGVSSRSACDALLDRRSATGSSRLIQADFVSGCTHAIADAME